MIILYFCILHSHFTDQELSGSRLCINHAGISRRIADISKKFFYFNSNRIHPAGFCFVILDKKFPSKSDISLCLQYFQAYKIDWPKRQLREIKRIACRTPAFYCGVQNSRRLPSGSFISNRRAPHECRFTAVTPLHFMERIL